MVDFTANERHRRGEAKAIGLRRNYASLQFGCWRDFTPHRPRWCLQSLANTAEGQRKKGKHCRDALDVLHRKGKKRIERCSCPRGF